MQWIDLTLGDPAHNLAMDEALLDSCESSDSPGVLRFWESHSYFVVLGYANQREREANVAACSRRGVPILRRCSGGGTVVQGPGCVNYNLVLPLAQDQALDSITGSNRFIMEKMRQTVERAAGGPVEVRGHTDLVWQGRKFSGNAQRRRRHCLVFHGCFLLNFDLNQITACLHMPSIMPDYRATRDHQEFLTNLPVSKDELKSEIRKTWGADQVLTSPPLEMTETLVRERYALEEWNGKY